MKGHSIQFSRDKKRLLYSYAVRNTDHSNLNDSSYGVYEVYEATTGALLYATTAIQLGVPNPYSSLSIFFTSVRSELVGFNSVIYANFSVSLLPMTHGREGWQEQYTLSEPKTNRPAYITSMQPHIASDGSCQVVWNRPGIAILEVRSGDVLTTIKASWEAQFVGDGSRIMDDRETSDKSFRQLLVWEPL
jgi:hypothetical protein